MGPLTIQDRHWTPPKGPHGPPGIPRDTPSRTPPGPPRPPEKESLPLFLPSPVPGRGLRHPLASLIAFHKDDLGPRVIGPKCLIASQKRPFRVGLSNMAGVTNVLGCLLGPLTPQARLRTPPAGLEGPVSCPPQEAPRKPPGRVKMPKMLDVSCVFATLTDAQQHRVLRWFLHVAEQQGWHN